MNSFRTCLLALVFATASASAQTVISSVPYTITASGQYVVDRNLIGASANVDLITVNAPNVLIDLGGFFVSGPGNTPTSTKACIRTNGGSNIVIRNGTLANMGYGISFDGSSTNNINHLAEFLNFTRCYIYGVYFASDSAGSQIRDSVYSQIGNTSTNTNAAAIYTFDGVRVERCVIAGVTAATVGTSSRGIDGGGGSFYINNTISNCTTGILRGKYRDNLTSNCTTPFSSGVDAGGNN